MQNTSKTRVTSHAFGTILDGRTYGILGRVGFGGMEKDDEVKGAGNSHTAEFWQYDPRLGKRFNIDPVKKVFLSCYAAFRNNPLWYIDPNGDDDFFSQQGKFLGSTPTGSAVRVINNTTTFDNAIKDIPNSTKLLGDFRYLPEDLSNRIMLSAIVTYYAPEAGIQNMKVGVADRDIAGKAGAAFHYDPNNDSFAVLVNSVTGEVNDEVNDKYDIINSEVHEDKHRNDPSTWKPLGHIDAILAEANHESFDKTTKNHKVAGGSYATRLLNEAIAQGASKVDVQKQVDTFNNSKFGESVLLFFDETANKVNYIANLDPVEVKPTVDEPSEGK